MEPNQVNPSPENTGIPQGIPTGVFVPNNQVPVTTDKPVQTTPTVETQPVAPVVQTPVQDTTVQPILTVVAPAPTGPGALERFFNGLAKFIAKITGNPDPITGALNTSDAAKKTDNIVGKVWNAANKAVEKASDAATKVTSTVTQATEKIQQVVPPPTVAQPVAPAPEQAPAAQPVPQTPAQ